MSSPVNDDLDKRVMYAPPWARESAAATAAGHRRRRSSG